MGCSAENPFDIRRRNIFCMDVFRKIPREKLFDSVLLQTVRRLVRPSGGRPFAPAARL